MPILNGAWRVIRRFITRGDLPAIVNPEIRRANDVHWCNDEPETVRADSSRPHGLYERVREQVLETQRNSELARREEIRRERRAKRRALTLLMGLLNPEQRHEFRNFRYFHVVGGNSGNRYRIRAATFANIDVLCANGRVKHRLCAHPAGDVPVYDVMAAQLLHLQDPATEQRFLQRANVHPALSEDRLHSRPAWFT